MQQNEGLDRLRLRNDSDRPFKETDRFNGELVF